MQPIPYYFESINRNAILVRPKKPFFDWLNDITKDEEPIVELDESNIYLIREMDSNEDVANWGERNFDQLFVNELNDWYTDEAGWPTHRTYQMFSDWFSVEIHSMLLDLEEIPISKD